MPPPIAPIYDCPRMIWGKALRSPLPHARIVRIDTSAAERLPGVLAVLTAKDLPDLLIGRRVYDMPVLAKDRVRFIGEKVAIVAAEDPDVAEEALGPIEVDYEELPAVFDAQEAMKPMPRSCIRSIGSTRMRRPNIFPTFPTSTPT